jgi:hypothetical protein
MAAVGSGKRQNNHTMVAADNVRIAKSAITRVRVVELVMPASPDSQSYM